MSRKPTGRPNGRPKIEIDADTFEGLCEIQCTKKEIASVLRVSEDTIERWCKATYGETFAVAYEKCSANGKKSLRRMQWDLAKTNASMAIFLGKNILGQRDNPDEDGRGNNELKIVVEKQIVDLSSGNERNSL